MARATVRTVACVLANAFILLSVLGKKIGAPWTYAALERGMEAYPGQATVRDLHDVYHYCSIGKQTRLIGVTGFGDGEVATAAALNAVLAHHQLPARCLPMGVGNIRVFRKVMEAVRLAGVVVDAAHQKDILEIAMELHPSAQQTQAA